MNDAESSSKRRSALLRRIPPLATRNHKHRPTSATGQNAVRRETRPRRTAPRIGWNDPEVHYHVEKCKSQLKARADTLVPCSGENIAKEVAPDFEHGQQSKPCQRLLGVQVLCLEGCGV